MAPFYICITFILNPQKEKKLLKNGNNLDFKNLE